MTMDICVLKQINNGFCLRIEFYSDWARLLAQLVSRRFVFPCVSATRRLFFRGDSRQRAQKQIISFLNMFLDIVRARQSDSSVYDRVGLIK